jgi:hypothetical protein
MKVPHYKMHNVLNVYSQRLGGRSKSDRSNHRADSPPPASQVQLSIEGKRQAVINKVAANIVARITRYGPQDDADQEILADLARDMGEKDAAGEGSGPSQAFTFTAIDERNIQTTNTMSTETVEFVTRRLEALARRVVDRNMARPQPRAGQQED